MSNSRIVGILAAIATFVTMAAGAINQISPKYGFWVLAISAGVSAFTGRVQGHPADEGK